jgi:FAD-dependent oxidoreductase family protein
MTQSLEIQREKLEYEVVVIGGGLAGVCAAVAAARMGVHTALVQNRPVLGGNSSAEIGVPVHGADQAGKYRHVRETGIIDEIGSLNTCFPNPLNSPSVWSLALWAFCQTVDNLTVLLNTQASIPTVKDDRLISFTAEQLTTEKLFDIHGEYFIDCSGDGVLAYRAGAQFMQGRESAHEFNESLAPDTADSLTMGNTVYMRARDLGCPIAFPTPPWVHVIESDDDLPNKGRSCPHLASDLLESAGGWWWIEYGGTVGTIEHGEEIRDELCRYTLGVWDHLKNCGDHGADNYVLESIGALPGKRDSRRFIGDYVMTQSDVESGCVFPDAVAYGGWHIDLHEPTGISGPKYWKGKLLSGPYSIPLRSLFSNNISNMYLAGRIISASHVAFGSSRVMATCSVIGQAAGVAAALCIQHDCDPRILYAEYIHELQQELIKQDCYIPGVCDKSKGNMAQSASVTASSTAALVFPDPDEYLPLDVPRGQSFVASGDSLDSVVLALDNRSQQPQRVIAHLHRSKRIDDFTSTNSIATAEATAPPGCTRVRFKLNATLSELGPYWIHLAANDQVAWGYSKSEVSATNAAQLVDQYFTEPGTDQFMDRMRGTYSLELDPPSNCFDPRQVISGVTRSDLATNLWVSHGPPPQWIELSWPEPVEVKQVHVTFDNDLDRTRQESAESGISANLARDYVIACERDGKWRDLVTVNDNIQRKRVHTVESSATNKLRLTVFRTWGGPYVGVYEVRAY